MQFTERPSGDTGEVVAAAEEVPSPGMRRRHVLGMLGFASTGIALPGRTFAAPASPATAPGSAGSIRIGQSADLSSPLARHFLPVLEGQKLALDDFNTKGGVAGRKVELITLDDAFRVKNCVENVDILIDEHKVTALFGLASAAAVTAVLPVLAAKQVPLVGVYTGATQLRAAQHPFFFTSTASYRDEVLHMMRNQKTLERDRIAVVYMNNAFGQPMVPMSEEIARELGVTLVAKAPLAPDGSNVAQAVQQAMKGNPRSVILLAFGAGVGPFVKAWKAASGVPLYAISIANTPQLLQDLGDDARGLALTQLTPSPSNPMPLIREFVVAAGRARLAADRLRLLGYIPMRVLLEGLKRGGRGVTPLSLVAELERMSNVDLGGFRINYSRSNHHGSSLVDIAIVGPNGRLIG